MLLFRRPPADQVGAIDLNRPRRPQEKIAGGSVNRPYLRAFASLLSILVLSASAPARENEKKKPVSPSPGSSPAEKSLANIPLAVGHEAKGLVLPDFDLDGHLRGKFEASTALRIDDGHIGFRGLRIITYTPENAPDFVIEMTNSVLDLKTRILTSKERTTIKRTDFSVAGDIVEFDTNSRTGKLTGNVKMVIKQVPAPKKKSE
jgi:hypothetical protein